MKTAWKVSWYGLQVVFILFCAIVTLMIFANVLLFFLPRDVAENLTQQARITAGLNLYHNPSLSDEALNANGDHKVVAQWIDRCLGSPSPKLLPREVQEILTGYPGMIDLTGDTEKMLAVHPYYLRLAQLSHSLLYRRMKLDENLSGAYSIAQIGVFLSIMIGLLTTVLVGLSSTEVGKQTNRTGMTIRIAALTMPALGTAVAAMIAFYDPSGNLARRSQVAAGLQQLHSQISITTWKMSCLKGQNDPVPQDVIARLDSWTQRMQELISNIGDSRAQTAGSENKLAAQKSQ